MKALKNLLAKFNRTAGQLKRYYDIDPLSFLKDKLTKKNIEKSLADMKREAERQKIAREVAEREARQEEARKQEEIMNKLEVDNILYMIKAMADSAKTPLARAEIQNSADVILRIIRDSIQTWNDYNFTAKALREWMEKHDRGLERLACAIYDEEYNTNLKYYERDEAGDRGRMTYAHDMASLASALKVPLPTLYFLA